MPLGNGWRCICEATSIPTSNKDLEVKTRRLFKLWFINYSEDFLNCLFSCDICGAPAPASNFSRGVVKSNYTIIVQNKKKEGCTASVNKSKCFIFSQLLFEILYRKKNGFPHRVPRTMGRAKKQRDAKLLTFPMSFPLRVWQREIVSDSCRHDRGAASPDWFRHSGNVY